METPQKIRRRRIVNLTSAEELHIELTGIAVENGLQLGDLELDVEWDGQNAIEVSFHTMETDAEVQARLDRRKKELQGIKKKRKKETFNLVEYIKANRTDPEFKKIIKEAGILDMSDFVSLSSPISKNGCGRPGHPDSCGILNEYMGCFDYNADQ